MALESHAKFDKKLALGFENDLNDLVNFNASCEKSENLHFDVVFFQQQLQFQLKKCGSVISHATEERSNL